MGGSDSRTLRIAVILFLVTLLVLGIVLFLLRRPLLSLYSLTPATYALADTLMIIMSVIMVGMSYQMPVSFGIIRGGGDAKFVLINDLISIWGIVIPVSLLAAFVFKWPPAVVIACLNADQVFKCGAAGIKVNRYTWMKKLTRKEE